MNTVIMELECIKYKERVQAKDAVCHHPGDYCKYRTSCIIQFMSSESKANNKTIKKSDNRSQEEKNGSEQ